MDPGRAGGCGGSRSHWIWPCFAACPSPSQGTAAPRSHSQLFLGLFCCMQLKNLLLTFSWGWGAREGRGGQEEATSDKCFLISAGPGPTAAKPWHLGRGEPGGVPSPSPVKGDLGGKEERPVASETASSKLSWMYAPAAGRFCIARLLEAVFFKR